MSDLLDDYDYQLPKELIASEPLPERDASRMLVLRRNSGKIEHRKFSDFPTFVHKEDIVVLNNSRVIRARLLTEKPRGELLLAEQVGKKRWICLVRPGRKWAVGTRRGVANTTAEVLKILPGGERIIEFEEAPNLEQFGTVPLPPYIERQPLPDDAD
ncbi:MAG: S-adenosylmethionine:tRNA ribosyltransferase-isomerase, partial [Chthoniobacterales bacterium]|nr:S-adenosylmethionine:tRNA ribosyltransferase-isomerase [Chthoniobacterales bacterium]